MAKIETNGTRRRARLFSETLSHYGIRNRYGWPGKGNDKGGVEGLVGYARRNFMVPIPSVPTWNAFNDWLEERCRKRQSNKLRGQAETIGERLHRGLEAMAQRPVTPFEACDQASGRGSSLSLLRYKTNDYSVPVAYGHRDFWIRAYVDRVVIGCGGEVIARHRRSYDRENMVFDPVHYLPLIEKTIGAFEQAGPLAGWELSKAFATLQKLMETRLLKAGRREYVQVLRLLETRDKGQVHPAMTTALQMGIISFGAVKHLALCRIERRPPKLDLDVYPYRPRATVETTSPGSYMCLTSGGELMTEAPQILLNHQLKTLNLPTIPLEYDKQARLWAVEGRDHVQFLARLIELELIDRQRRMIERWIKEAKLPVTQSLESFDFAPIPWLKRMQVLELARCEKVIALGPVRHRSRTHGDLMAHNRQDSVALGLGLAACQKGMAVRFITAAAIVHELMEARDERPLLRFQKQLVKQNLVMIDELGFVPLSKTGAELLFGLISQRYEGDSIFITSNLPFDEWTETFGSERLTGALLDRFTHHVSILEMNDDSYRLAQSKARQNS